MGLEPQRLGQSARGADVQGSEMSATGVGHVWNIPTRVTLSQDEVSLAKHAAKHSALPIRVAIENYARHKIANMNHVCEVCFSSAQQMKDHPGVTCWPEWGDNDAA